MNKAFILIKNNYILFSLIFIIVLGAILRFKGLIFNSYWLDELASAYFSNPSRSFNSMLKVTLEDVHPPFYQILLWLWYKMFGFTEFVGRSLSAIIGVLSIITIYFLGKELFNKQVGLYAALLVSTNIFLIKYSQEMRSYELFFLLAMLSYMYLHRVVYNPSKTNVILYLITTIVLFYTHYFTFFILATQLVVIIVYIIRFSENKKQLFTLTLWMAGLLIIAMLPLVPYILEATKGSGLAWIKPPTPYFFISYIIGYFGSYDGIGLLLIVFLGGVISLIYLLRGKLSDREKFSLILLLIWILLGYLLPYLKSILSSPLLNIRYTIFVIAPIILVASYGFWRIRGWKGYLILSFYFLYSLGLLFSNYYGHVQKDQYREVLQEVSKYKSVPVYEYTQKGQLTNWLGYQIYEKMLKLNINIKNTSNLTKDLKDGNLPECFWVLNAHSNFPSNYIMEKSEIIKNQSIQIVKKIDYKRAVGVLLSYKTEPGFCAQKVGLKKGAD